jgi:hypothetical protein
MGKLNEIGAVGRIEIDIPVRHHSHELSAQAVGYLALALCGVLALAWFAATAWLFDLIGPQLH